MKLTEYGSALVLGLGKTGLSAVRFLRSRGIEVKVADSRKAPPGLDILHNEYPEIPIFCGAFEVSHLLQAEVLIISPGVALSEPALQLAQQQGIPIIGDIELFFHYVAPEAKILVITGSNGKSTVSRLVADMLEAEGKKVALGANYGTPALDLLVSDADVYVLELSSFQLETTFSLRSDAAVVLNISADHMDRYKDLDHYANTKVKVYQHCKAAIINLDDPWIQKNLLPGNLLFEESVEGLKSEKARYFSASTSLSQGYSVLQKEGQVLLTEHGEHFYPTLALPGKHYLENSLASIALAKAIACSDEAIVHALKSFKGLPHRCQWVRRYQQVSFINDSKGTNVGATLAAINGMMEPMVLIAGGEGKGADFFELARLIISKVRAVVLMGQDAESIARAIFQCDPNYRVVRVNSMSEAVFQAFALTCPGDLVLLSPACASLDMYQNYQQRGEDFIEKVMQLSV